MVYLPLELKFCQNSDCVHVLCGQFCCKSNYTVVLSRKQFFFCVKSQLKFNLVSCYLTFKQIITYSLQKFSIQKHTATVTKKACTHTHTHTFNGPFSGTTRVSRYQKGKTNLDFTEARDSEWQTGSGISLAICKSASQSRQITMPVPHDSCFFTDRMPFLPPNQQRQSTEGNNATASHQLIC